MKRRNFLKTQISAAIALTTPLAHTLSAEENLAESAATEKKWQITQKMPLPPKGDYQAIFAADGKLWALSKTAVFLYSPGDSEAKDAEKWIPYAENLPGTAWCFCVTTAEEKPDETRIYVGLLDAKTKKPGILILENGKPGELWTDGFTPASRLTSITVMEDEDGTPAIFAADAGLRNVLRFSAAGKFQHLLFKPGQLIVPSPFLATCVGRDGLLHVANPGRFRVEAFHVYADRTEAEKSLAWGTAGLNAEAFAGCCNPAWLAVTPDGSYLTSEKRFLRVKLHDLEGKLLTVIPLPPYARNAVPEGFPVAADGDALFLLNPKSKIVFKYQNN